MAADKHGFEVKAHVNSVEVAVGDKLVRLESGAVYETADQEEIRALDAHPSVKTADAPAKSTGGKG